MQPVAQYFLEYGFACALDRRPADVERYACRREDDPNALREPQFTVAFNVVDGQIGTVESTIDRNGTDQTVEDLVSGWFGETFAEAPLGLPPTLKEWLAEHPRGGVGQVDETHVSLTVGPTFARIQIDR